MRTVKFLTAATLAGLALAWLPGCNDQQESGTQIQPNLEAAKQQKNAMENFYKSQPKTAKAAEASAKK